MNSLRPSALLLAALALAASAFVHGRTSKGGFEIGVGKERKVEGSDLTLAFLEVTEDSRCPEGAMCIWAGNARARMTVRTPRCEPVEFGLNTNVLPREFVFGDYKIGLAKLTPHPSIKNGLDASKYTVELAVSRFEKKEEKK